MKPDIHPNYKPIKAVCACGNKFDTQATTKSDELHVDICSACHPFYTGKQKFVDTAGRVEKFQKRFGGDYFKTPAKAGAKAAAK